MSRFERLTRPLGNGHEITILTPGRLRRGGSQSTVPAVGRTLRRGGSGDHHPLQREVGPRGRSHVLPAVDPIAVHTHTAEVSMRDR